MRLRSWLKMFGINPNASHHEIQRAYDDDLARSLESRGKIVESIMHTTTITHQTNKRLAECVVEAKQTFKNVIDGDNSVRGQVEIMLARMKKSRKNPGND